MRYRILNIISTLGAVLGFIISFISINSQLKIAGIIFTFICICLILFNSFLNKNPEHSDSIMLFDFFSLTKGKRNDGDSDSFDD